MKKETINNTITKNVLILAVLALIIGISIYFYNKNQDKKDAEFNKAVKELNLKQDYDTCLSWATYNYNANWSNGCEKQYGKESCESLPGFLAEPLNDQLKEDNKSCLETYKIMSSIELKD